LCAKDGSFPGDSGNWMEESMASHGPAL
jgi:hypothetical protein